MPIFENDRALLDAFREGQRPALERVYQRYFDEILAIVRHGYAVAWKGNVHVRGVDVDAAQDLVQEVFVRAFAPPARLAFDGLRPYGPYLRTIARNLLADALRHRRPEVELTDEMLDGTAAVPPDEDERFDEEAAIAQTFIAALDETRQTFVRLRFVEGLSQVDVAERMGTTRRHMRTLEKRITKELRKYLKSRGVVRD